MLPPKQHATLLAFHEKKEIADKHKLSFSIAILAKSLGERQGTLYSNLKYLVDKGYMKKTKKDGLSLSKKGLEYVKSV